MNEEIKRTPKKLDALKAIKQIMEIESECNPMKKAALLAKIKYFCYNCGKQEVFPEPDFKDEYVCDNCGIAMGREVFFESSNERRDEIILDYRKHTEK